MAQFDTSLIEYSDRLDYWRSAISSTFVPLSCEFKDSERIGRLSSLALGDISLARVSCGPQKVTRSLKGMDNFESESVLISFMQEGTTEISQGRKSTLLKRGEFALYDTRKPYGLHVAGASSQIVVQMPRLLLNNHLGDVDELMAHSFGRKHPMSHFTRAFLENIFSLPEDVPEHYLDSLSAQATGLIFNMITDECRSAPYHPDTKQALLAQIQLYIRQRITDPELSSEEVALKFGISSRYLRMLFQQEDLTFGRFLLQSRLEHCKGLLRLPQHQQKLLGDIAWSCGFNDISYFSREFKKQFGVTPREFRRYDA